MKPRKPIARTTRPKRVNKVRKAREWARAYGSEERVAWIRDQPCVAGHSGPCENSHLRSRSGAGRKGDAATVVPMCKPCHNLYPKRSAWAAKYPELTDDTLNVIASATDHLWTLHNAK